MDGLRSERPPPMPKATQSAEELGYGPAGQVLGITDSRCCKYAEDSEPAVPVPLERARGHPAGLAVGEVAIEPGLQVKVHGACQVR